MKRLRYFYCGTLALFLLLIPAVAQAVISDHYIDVTDESQTGGAGTALTEGDVGGIDGANGKTNATNLQAIINASFTGVASTAEPLFFPPGVYEIGATITLPNNSGFYMVGGGGIVKGEANLDNATTGATILRWTGNTTGPMFDFRNSSGVFVERINFDGVHGPDTVAGGAGSGLANLIIWDADSAGFFSKFHFCSFWNAHRLFYMRDSVASAPAEITFDKCLFRNNETASATRFDSVACYGDENQTVNCLWLNCEFNQCGTAVRVDSAGRVIMRDTTAVTVGYLLEVDRQSQNVSGNLIDQCHIDMQDATRCCFYRSHNSQQTGGPVVIRQMKQGTTTFADQYPVINSYTGNTLTLATAMRVREGDRIAFVNAQTAGRRTKLAESVVVTRNSDTSYVLADTAVDLEITIDATVFATHGEALITAIAGEQVLLEDTYLTLATIQFQRLARLNHTTFVGGRPTILYVNRCMGFADTTGDAGFTPRGFKDLLHLTPENNVGATSVWWKFSDCFPRSDDFGPPMTASNFPTR